MSTEPSPIILASASEIRLQMLRAAAVPVESIPARVDEETVKQALLAEGAHARDIADTLAEMKARKVAEKQPGRMVLGADQVLTVDGALLSKPSDPEECKEQLRMLRGKTHHLTSAAVIYDNAEPVWRHADVARLTMANFSDAYLDDYVARNWDSIRWSVGGYKLEEEGVRLFAQVTGSHFTILGLPLLPLLSYLSLRGIVPA